MSNDTYSHNMKCDNCHAENTVHIPRGTSVDKYLREKLDRNLNPEGIPCRVCGCVGYLRSIPPVW